MPVSSAALDSPPSPSPASSSRQQAPAPPPPAPHCRHCQESRFTLANGSAQTVYWSVRLDRDLLETIVSIYPEWFKGCNLNLNGMAEGGSSGNNGGAAGGTTESTGVIGNSSQAAALPIIPLSPPKAEVDDSPLQKAMDRNKESLKVKLMLRRPINQLVEQGILPPLKTPPAFAEQRQRLERAKMSDVLKAKIQRRPDREELVRQHILEDTGKVDPSLAERQRMLKKARLADSLNDQLSHRPGPLELIQKNILHTDESMERAIKEGQIAFRATCEGQALRPQHPNMYISFEEDSSSEGGSSPPQDTTDPGTPAPSPAPAFAPVTTVNAALVPVLTHVDAAAVVVEPAPSTAVSSPSLGSTTSTLSPLSSIASPPSVAAVASPATVAAVAAIAQPAVVSSSLTRANAAMAASVSVGAAVKAEMLRDQSKNRKKSKTKAQPKARTIKFHEYKGPPNAQKSQQSNPAPGETSYELLLQQQQLFLQWQLQLQHKYPQIILPAAQKSPTTDTNNTSTVTIPVMSTSQNPSQVTTSCSVPAQAAAPIMTTTTVPEVPIALGKLEDMKVSDLKAELKKRNLPVSGSKPQLIERLKQFSKGGTVSMSSTPVSTPAPPTPSPSPAPVSSPEQPQPAATTMANVVVNGTTVAIPVSMASLIVGSNGQITAVRSSEDGNAMTVDTQTLLSTSVPTSNETTMTTEGDLSSAASQASPLRPSSVMAMEMDLDFDNSMDTSECNSIINGSMHAPSPSPPTVMQSAVPISTVNLTLAPASPSVHVVPAQVISEEIIQQQQRHIEELQRELQKSQQQLQAIRQKEKETSAAAANAANPSSTQPIDLKQHQRMVLQQHLHNKIQQQQLQTQLQTLLQLQTLQQQQMQQQQLQAGLKAGLATFIQPQKAQTTVKKEPIKQRSGSLPNGLTATHQRTGSLPNFFGAFLQPQVQVQPSSLTPVQLDTGSNTQLKLTLAQPIASAGTSTVVSVAVPSTSFTPATSHAGKPPPQYEEATKQLQQQTEASTGATSRTTTNPKHIKSQIVDDVLEILIKNGELPPSAAQDPATPTTPGRQLQGIVFAPVSTTATTSTATKVVYTESSNKSPPPPPPPPPPPLPPSTFAVTLPTVVPLTCTNAHVTNADNSIDAVLDSLLAQTTVPALQSTPSIDLSDLEVDLDTLDEMDLGHLDSEFPEPMIKMEPDSVLQSECHPPMSDPLQQDFLELPDMQMDMQMDVTDWLETLIPSSSSNSLGNATTTSFVQTQPSVLQHYESGDPLLGTHHQDPFDLFNIDDMDTKATPELSSLLWDRVDFTT